MWPAFRAARSRWNGSRRVTAHADAQLTDRRAVILLQQEPGAAGKSYVDAQMRGPLLGFAVEVERPTGDKYTRALPMSSAAQAGNIKLVRGKWNKDFIDELEQAGPDEKTLRPRRPVGRGFQRVQLSGLPSSAWAARCWSPQSGRSSILDSRMTTTTAFGPTAKVQLPCVARIRIAGSRRGTW